MRRIIFAVFFLELIAFLECRSLLYKCSTGVGNLAIFVCTNRTEIQCSLGRITIPINALTIQERKCIENVDRLGQNLITCTNSQRCHTAERVAHYKLTCAVLAVREITTILPQFTTLCCRRQQSLIDLYFTVEKEVFKSLLTSIKTGSLQSVSVNLRRTQWCRGFFFKCGKIVALLEAGCEHYENRKRRNVENTSATEQDSKQTHSTSLTGSAQPLSTSLSSTLARIQTIERTVLQQTIVPTSSLASYRDIPTRTQASLPRISSQSQKNTIANHHKMQSRIDSSAVATQTIATYPKESLKTTSSLQGDSLPLSKESHKTMSSIVEMSKNTEIVPSKIKQSVTPTSYVPVYSLVVTPRPSSTVFTKERLSTSVTFSEESKSTVITKKTFLPRNSLELKSSVALPKSSKSKSIDITSKQEKLIPSRISRVTKQQQLLSGPDSLNSSPWQLSLVFLPSSSLVYPTFSTSSLLPRATILSKASTPSLKLPSLLPSSSLVKSSSSSPRATTSLSKAPTPQSLRLPSPSLRSSSSSSSSSSSPLSSNTMFTGVLSQTPPSLFGNSTISLKDSKSSIDSLPWSSSNSSLTKKISPSITSSPKRSFSYPSIDASDILVDVSTKKASPALSAEPLSTVTTILSSIDQEEGYKSAQHEQRTLSKSSSVKDVTSQSVEFNTTELNKTFLPMLTRNIKPSTLSESSSVLHTSTSSVLSQSSSASFLNNLSPSLVVPRSMTLSSGRLQSINVPPSPTPLSSSVTSSAKIPTLSLSLPSSTNLMNKTVFPVPSNTSLATTFKAPLKTNVEDSSATSNLMPSPSIATLNETSIFTKKTETLLVKEMTVSLPFTSQDTFSRTSMITTNIPSLPSSYYRNTSISMHVKKEMTSSIPSTNVTDTLTDLASSSIKYSSSSLFKMTSPSSSLALSSSKITSATEATSSFSISTDVSLVSSAQMDAIPPTLTEESLHPSSDILLSSVTKTTKVSSTATSIVSSTVVSSFMKTSVSDLFPSLSPSLSLLPSSPLSLSPSLLSSKSSFPSLNLTLPLSSSSSPISSKSISNVSLSLSLLSPSPKSVPVFSPSYEYLSALPSVSSSSSPSSFSPTHETLTLPSVSSSSSSSSFSPTHETLTLPSVSSSSSPSSSSSFSPTHESLTLPSVSSSSSLTSSSSFSLHETLTLPSMSSSSSSLFQSILSPSLASPMPESPTTSYLGPPPLLTSSIILASKTISSTKVSSLPSSFLSVQSISTKSFSSPESITLRPSTIPVILSSMPSGSVNITTSKLQTLANTTAKLQHSFTSAIAEHDKLSTVESRQTSSYELTPSESKTGKVETALTVTEILAYSTKTTLAPSNTQATTAMPSVILDYIQIFLITFDGICPSSNEQESFKIAFIRTMRRLIAIERSSVDIHSIKCGSVKVVFSIKCEQFSKIPEILEGLVRDGDFQVSMNGMIFKALNITTLNDTTHPSLPTTTSTDNPSVYAKEEDQKRAIKIIFILFAAAFGALALFGTVICIAKSCGRRQFGKLRLNSSTLSTRGTNQIYKNELELVRLSPLHHGADYYGGHVIQPRDDSDDDEKIDNRTALLNRLRNDEVALRRGKIIIKDDDSYSSIAFY